MGGKPSAPSRINSFNSSENRSGRVTAISDAAPFGTVGSPLMADDVRSFASSFRTGPGGGARSGSTNELYQEDISKSFSGQVDMNAVGGPTMMSLARRDTALPTFPGIMTSSSDSPAMAQHHSSQPPQQQSGSSNTVTNPLLAVPTVTAGRRGKGRDTRVRIGTPEPQEGRRVGNSFNSPACPSISSNFSNAAATGPMLLSKSVVPMELLIGHELVRAKKFESPPTPDRYLNTVAGKCTHVDMMAAHDLPGDFPGAVLTIGDCGDDIVAVVLLLSRMEAYSLRKHGRLLCTLFSYVLCCGSGGFLAAGLAQGDTCQKILDLLIQHDGVLLHRGLLSQRLETTYVEEPPHVLDTMLRVTAGEDGPKGASSQRRMFHRYTRGDYLVCRPCVIAVERRPDGRHIRRIDWQSNALMHRIVAVAADHVVDLEGHDAVGDSGALVDSGLDEVYDPALFALSIVPRVTAVCRISVARYPADEVAGEVLSDDFGAAFVDITLPAIDEKTPRTPALQPLYPLRAASSRRSSGNSNITSDLHCCYTPMPDVTPMVDLLKGWGNEEVDRERRAVLLSQTDQFATREQDNLEAAIDFIVSKAQGPVDRGIEAAMRSSMLVREASVRLNRD